MKNTHHSEQVSVSPPVTPTPENPRRKLRPVPFAIGLLLTTGGVAILLLVAAGALRRSGMMIEFPLPVVAIFTIFALMMLVGGFGLMATAAPELDDGEFNRLMRAGDPSPSPFDATPPNSLDEDLVEESQNSIEETVDSFNPEQWGNAPKRSGRQEGDSDKIQKESVACHLPNTQSA